MTQFNFIAGLPRSGSTLLAAILRQNPKITASMSSPVGAIMSVMQKAISGDNEAAMFLTEGKRQRLLRQIFDEYYSGCGEIVLDTNRIWPSKLSLLVSMFPDCRIICCVRPVAWIMDSIERLIRRNSLELSGIFGYESGGTVYSRCQSLASSNGLIGFALDALREGFYGQHSDRLLLVEYEALAKHPRHTIGAVYEWLNLPYYDGHDYENVEPIPGADEFDKKIGTPGLHDVARKVEWKDRETILPPDIFASFGNPFWRSNNPRVPVIHCADRDG